MSDKTFTPTKIEGLSLDSNMPIFTVTNGSELLKGPILQGTSISDLAQCFGTSYSEVTNGLGIYQDFIRRKNPNLVPSYRVYDGGKEGIPYYLIAGAWMDLETMGHILGVDISTYNLGCISFDIAMNNYDIDLNIEPYPPFNDLSETKGEVYLLSPNSPNGVIRLK